MRESWIRWDMFILDSAIWCRTTADLCKVEQELAVSVFGSGTFSEKQFEVKTMENWKEKQERKRRIVMDRAIARVMQHP